MFVAHSNWEKHYNRTQILTKKKTLKKPKNTNQTTQKNTLPPNSHKRSKPTVHFLMTSVFKASPPSALCPLMALFTNLLQICCTLALTLQLFLCCSPANVKGGTRYSWHGSFSRMYVPHQ